VSIAAIDAQQMTWCCIQKLCVNSGEGQYPYCRGHLVTWDDSKRAMSQEPGRSCYLFPKSPHSRRYGSHLRGGEGWMVSPLVVPVCWSDRMPLLVQLQRG
jgi:hypothetical protein